MVAQPRRAHPGVRPVRHALLVPADFCEALDPQSKGLVENVVGHGKDDLMRPLLLEHALQEGAAIDESFVVSKVLADPPAANARGAHEVNANVHSP